MGHTIRATLKSFLTGLADLGPRKGPAGRAALTRGQTSMDRVTIVALMDADNQDGRLLAVVGGRSGWNVVFVETCSDAMAVLDEARAPVVLCDRELLGIEWRNAVERLSGPPHQACVTLLSETFDSYLWNDVVRAGGYDVLVKPLKDEEIVRAVRLARTYWNGLAGDRLQLEDWLRSIKGARS